MISNIDVAVIGGGAAGIFAAINAKRAFPSAHIVVLEKSAVLLAKVKVSGGGRCNVTHSCFDPKLLVQNYPRGEKELLGPFHRFQPRDTVEWFESRGARLKTEADGRMFPVTDSSQTIIEKLLGEAEELGVEIRLRERVEAIVRKGGGFEITLKDKEPLFCRSLILATGSGADGHAWAASIGHTIQKPVPSLFTFNVPTSPLLDLSGIAVQKVKLQLEGTSYTQTGPLLITHFGFSGPAALKLSAWAARYLFEQNYRVTLLINWLPDMTEEEIVEKAPFNTLLPKNLWKRLTGSMDSKKEVRATAQKLRADPYIVEGKTTHKEEFVTCGGVTLKEVDFKTMQSKICPRLYFAGEVLDIDGVTGGFNFQSAWTTGFIAGSSCLS